MVDFQNRLEAEGLRTVAILLPMLNYQTLLLVLIVLTTMTTLLFIAAALATDALEEQRIWAFASVSISPTNCSGSWKGRMRRCTKPSRRGEIGCG